MTTELTVLAWGSSRLVFLPVYALGIPVVRTLVFMVGLAGIVMLLWRVLA